VTEYAYINSIANKWKGKDLCDVPLPGDEPDILRQHIRRAIKRDEWFNQDEVAVWLCMRARLYYETEWCMTPGCTWCRNQWRRWG
jgi:hypothetical protein